MELIRTLLVLTMIGLRVGECMFRPTVYDGHFPTHNISVQPDITYGHLTFYQHFVSSYQSVVKKQKLLYSLSCKRRNVIPVYLLLCGDVHPCPGPMGSRCDNSSDYSRFHKKGLHFVHLNIRSLLPKIDEVRMLARNTRAACICMTETWLDETVFDSEIQIDNYVLRRQDRNRHGGGVCIYVRSDLSFNPRDDLSHDELEATWIDLILPKTKPILCGVVYRPPQQCNFYNLLEDLCLAHSEFIENECIILGDFNTDVSKSRRCNLVKSLFDIMNMYNFSQIISDVTRVSKTSSSIIDLILISDTDKISQSGVLDLGISDHCLTYCTRKVLKTTINSHNTVKIRSMKNYNKETFQLNLLDVDWSSVLCSDNVIQAWENFKSIFMSAIDNIAPLKEVRIKQRTEPWITNEILQCIKDRDKAFRLYKKDSSDENFSIFKGLRNKTQTMIYTAKRDYFKEKVENENHDSKSLWNSLKELGMPSKKSKATASAIGLKIDDKVCFDRRIVAEKFNSFYTTVASKLVQKLPKGMNKFGKHFVEKFYRLKGVKPNDCSFSIVSENKVLKCLNKLGAKKATGLDGIPARFVRDSASIIACPLRHVINLSLIQGIVPDDLKSARVVPLFKKSDKTEVGNYRPVSILSIISKVFERVVYDQLETYLDERKLLYNLQSGFRPRFSTDTCLIHLTDFIKFQMDKGNVVGMVLLDLQKAFDTVVHSILLTKLEALGLSNDAVRWFRSYLSDRQQLVDVSGTFSSCEDISCGVPQGSILGPLLFLIYVNDMSGVVENKLLLYADDSAILVADKDISTVENLLQTELQIVSEWLIDNKLSLHLGKTESILFGSKPRLRSRSNLKIECKGSAIEPKDKVKYLGAILEQTLTGESMVNSILQKANARLKFLYRKQKFLNLHTKKLLVMSLIQCHFDYACSFWYMGLSKLLKNRLQVTQNKIIRFVLKMDPRSHVGANEFKSLGWLPVSRRVEQIVLNHVFKIKSGKSADYMTENFIQATSVHSYGTRFRESGCFSIPKVKGFGKKSFVYSGCILWNDLPNNIKEIQGIYDFKMAVKKHFLQLLS